MTCRVIDNSQIDQLARKIPRQIVPRPVTKNVRPGHHPKIIPTTQRHTHFCAHSAADGAKLNVGHVHTYDIHHDFS